jgi:hypothetical protein
VCSLVPPRDPHVEVTGIKEALAGKTAKPWAQEFKEYATGKGDNPLRFRQAKWGMLARILIERCAKAASLKLQKEQPLWVLLPGFSDQEVHNLYRNAMREIVTEALRAEEVNFLFEPEMVMEYFRLIRRSLPEPAGGNPLYLVVDCGALTCNISLIVGTRSGESTAKVGRWRGVLQPISGAAKGAGRWIDDQFAARIEAKFGPIAESRRLGEAVKLRLAVDHEVLLRREGDGRELACSRADLDIFTEQVWVRCKDELEVVFAKAYKQLSDPKADKGRYAQRLETEEIQSPNDLAKLLSAVVFAGGSSQLPGFQKHVVDWLGWKHDVISVGSEYAAVPVLGAAAHVLHQSGKLSWEGPLDGGNLEGEIEQPSPFVASLPDDIVLRGVFKDGERSEAVDIDIVQREGWTIGLDRNQEVSFPLQWQRRSGTSALVWKAHLRGVKHAHVGPCGSKLWQQFGVGKTHSGRVSIRISNGTVRVDTLGVTPSASHFADLKRILEVPPSTPPKREERRSDVPIVVTEAAPDLILDFGMSKVAFASVDEGVVIRPDHFVGQGRVSPPSLPPGWVLKSTGDTPGHNPLEVVKEAFRRAEVQLSEEVGRRVRAEEREALIGNQLTALRLTIAEKVGREKDLERRLDEAEAISIMMGNQASSSRAALADIESRLFESDSKLAEAVAEVSRLRADPPANGYSHSTGSVFDRASKLGGHIHPSPRVDIPNEREFFEELVAHVGKTGLQVPKSSLLHLHLSAKTTPMVLLAGPPGVGKSALARLYAGALGLGGTQGNMERVPVEASWTSSQGIFGTGSAVHHLSPFLQLACRSVKRSDELFVALLDECNLAHMDYYFAPLLSAMEDDGRVEVHGETLTLPCRAPHHRFLLFGTLNVDDAGTSLTDKVLDRASILELDEGELGEDLAADVHCRSLPPPVAASAWTGMCRLEERLAVPRSVLDLWKELQVQPLERVARPTALKQAAADFKTAGRAPMGKRVARQVCAYVYYARALAGPGEEDEAERVAVDQQILTRILPRMRGDSRMAPLLERLWSYCVRENRAFSRSAARIERMYAQLSHDHAFDFWTS